MMAGQKTVLFGWPQGVERGQGWDRESLFCFLPMGVCLLLEVENTSVVTCRMVPLNRLITEKKRAIDEIPCQRNKTVWKKYGLCYVGGQDQPKILLLMSHCWVLISSVLDLCNTTTSVYNYGEITVCRLTQQTVHLSVLKWTGLESVRSRIPQSDLLISVR